MPREVKVSLSRLRLAWADRSKTAPEIARDFGMSVRTLQGIVKGQGWPPRTARQRCAVLTPEAVRPLWEVEMRCCDIAVLLGSSTAAVQAVAWRAGWRRFKGWRPKMSLDQYLQARMAERMATVAAEEMRVHRRRAA